MKDSIKIKGRLTIKNLTRNVPDIVLLNLVTANGLSLFADRMMDNSVAFIDYIGIGDGVGSHTTSSTSLYNEIFRKQTDSKTNPGSTASFTFVILGNEAIGTWTEIGMFNAAVAGSMTNVVEQAYNHIAGDNVQLVWSIINS